MEGKITDEICLNVDSYEYRFTIGELMKTSRILPQYKESIDWQRRCTAMVEHYRDDFYWHNAYKTRLRQAVPESAYTMEFSKTIEMEPGSQYRLRVWLKTEMWRGCPRFLLKNKKDTETEDTARWEER